MCPSDVDECSESVLQIYSNHTSDLRIDGVVGPAVCKYRLINMDVNSNAVEFSTIYVDNAIAAVYKENKFGNFTWLVDLNHTMINPPIANFTSSDVVWLLIVRNEGETNFFANFEAKALTDEPNPDPKPDNSDSNSWKGVGIAFISVSIILLLTLVCFCVYVRVKARKDEEDDDELMDNGYRKAIQNDSLTDRVHSSTMHGKK